MSRNVYFVLYTHNPMGEPLVAPWVLDIHSGEPDHFCQGAFREAQRAIDWQVKGGSFRHEMSICKRVGPDTFQRVWLTPTGVMVTDNIVTADRGCYTIEAWERFKAGWKD